MYKKNYPRKLRCFKIHNNNHLLNRSDFLCRSAGVRGGVGLASRLPLRLIEVLLPVVVVVQGEELLVDDRERRVHVSAAVRGLLLRRHDQHCVLAVGVGW